MAVRYLLGVAFLMGQVAASSECSVSEIHVNALDCDTGKRKDIATLTDEGSTFSGNTSIRTLLNRQYNALAKVKNFLRQNLGKELNISMSLTETASAAENMFQADDPKESSAVIPVKMKGRKLQDGTASRAIGRVPAFFALQRKAFLMFAEANLHISKWTARAFRIFAMPFQLVKFLAESFKGISSAVAMTGLSRTGTLVVSMATAALPFLAAVDCAFSAYLVGRAVYAMIHNTNPDYDTAMTYDVVIASAGLAVSLIAAALVALFLTSYLGPVGFLVGSAILLVVSIGLFFLSISSSLHERAAQKTALRQRYKDMQVAPCQSVTTEFFRYLVKVAREMEYLASSSSNVRNSSIFDLGRLSADSDVHNPYVHLAKIVIEEKKVIPTLSPKFVKQLRDTTRHAEISSQTRAVSIDKVILPSNLFLSVGSHDCAPPGADTGLCNAAAVRRVLITSVRFLDYIRLKDGHGLDEWLDPVCTVLVRGSPKAEVRATNNNNPGWTTDILLDLGMEHDGFMEGFDFQCWDDDGFVSADDPIGNANVRLDTSRNIMVLTFDDTEKHLASPVDIKFTYEIHEMHETPYEWIPAPLDTLKECKHLVDFTDLSFISCEFRCDAREGCNARRYSAVERKCGLYRCDAPPAFELEGVESVNNAAYFRQESVNCGGYYARSCEHCDGHCFGQCRMDEDICVKRTCGDCVFPFTDGKRTYWGCTSQSTSYPGQLKCATKVDRNWNTLEWADCDKREPQCKQLCGTHHCSSSWSESPSKECDGDCTDAQCCRVNNRRVLRMISENEASLYDVPQNVSIKKLGYWKAAGEKLLVFDKQCVGRKFGGTANNENLRSRVHAAEIGHSSLRKLEVVVNTDSLVLESKHIFLPTLGTGFYELTPLQLHYNIELIGGKDTNEPEGKAVGGKTLQPLRYTLIMPGFDFGRDTLNFRSSSYSYTLHKKNPRETIVSIALPAYAEARLAGYSWKGQYGLFQSCIKPFAKPLHEVKAKWQMRLMSTFPARSVVRYRAIKMGTMVNDKIVFAVWRGTHSCRINYMEKTFAIAAIDAYRPAEQLWSEGRKNMYKYNSTAEFMRREMKFNHTKYLGSILETLEEYRNAEVPGFRRDEMPVQVFLTKEKNASFYLNAASGLRPWTVFVPRVHVQQLHMDYQIDSLDDTLLKSQQMLSYNVLPGMINVTYAIPSLGHPLVPLSLSTVTLFLPFSENARVTKVVCPMCTVKAVMDVLHTVSRDDEVILNMEELRIVHTHHFVNGSLVLRDAPLVLYTSSKMGEHRYVPYNASVLLPLGYFDVISGDCVLAVKSAENSTVSLHRASPVFKGDTAEKIAPIRIPRRLVHGNASLDRFQNVFKSENRQCPGVIVISADSTVYCVTCAVATILESPNHIAGPDDDVWSYLSDGDEDSSSPPPFDVPRFEFFHGRKGKADGYHGIMQYRNWTFRIPDSLVDGFNATTAKIPWSADFSRHRRYFFDGIVRVDPVGEGRVFVLWTTRNVSNYGGTSSFICDHNHLGTGKCAQVVDDFETIEDSEEVRIVETGVGTWVLRWGENTEPNEYTVDRVVVADKLKNVSARFPTLLFQQGNTSKFAHRGCEFDLGGTLSLLSRGAVRFSARGAPNGFFLTEDGYVAEMHRDCNVSVTKVKLDGLMKSEALSTGSLYLSISLSSNGSAPIPRVPGYSMLSFSFSNVKDNITIVLRPEWEEAKGPVDVALFVEERVKRVQVGYQGRSIQLSDEAHRFNPQLSVEVVRVPDVVVESDENREKNIDEVDTFHLYRSYQVAPAFHDEPGKCDVCGDQDICLPNGSCIQRADVYSRLLPVWRAGRTSPRLPTEMYCTKFRSIVRCANLHNLYTYVARLFNDGTQDIVYDNDILETSFGSIAFCSTNACFADRVESILKSRLIAPSFVLKMVTTNDTSARVMLWPNLERNSSRGVGGAALLEISREDSCDRLRSIPPQAKTMATKDPDGFARLVEQIYFEATVNSASSNSSEYACVRVSSAYAALETQQYQTLRDSADHLRRVASQQQLSCGASLEVATESTSRNKSLLAADFGEAGVDMRISSVFTVLESLITLVDVAREQNWNLSGLKQQDLLWSLLKDGDFLYFEQFGGITLKNWPENINQHGSVGAWDGGFDTNGTVLGPLLKRLLDVLPRHSLKSGIHQSNSAMGLLHEWSKMVEVDFKYKGSMQNSIMSLQKLKSDFPNIENCATPIDPKYSARRYICNKFGSSSAYQLLSVRLVKFGRFRLAPAGSQDAARIDDSCDSVRVNLTICFGTDRFATIIEVRYNGVDWAPELKKSRSQLSCRPSDNQNSIVPGNTQDITAPSITNTIPSRSDEQDISALLPARQWNNPLYSRKEIERVEYRPKTVRVRIKDARYLCAMRNARDRNIRAAQRYDIFPDLAAEGYMGTSDPRYRLRRNNASGLWGLYYRSRNKEVVLTQWNGTRANEMVDASGSFVVDDPFYETAFEAHLIISRYCLGDVTLPPVVPSEINAIAHAVPVPFYQSCDDFVNVAQSYTCDAKSSLLRWLPHTAAAECESECAKNDRCKYYTQFTDSCQLWATCSKMERVGDTTAKIFARTINENGAHCWKTVSLCDSAPAHPFGSWKVRICTKKSECVESKVPKLLHALQDANRPNCDLKCVKEEWEGPDHLLRRLRHTCTLNGAYVYHACGVQGGLQVDAGHSCSWNDNTNEPVEFRIEAHYKACVDPKKTRGYDLSSITSQDFRIETFNIHGIKCKDGYDGKPIAIACSSAGGEYTLQGCVMRCTAPRRPIGYNLDMVRHQDLRAETFRVDGILCKDGYEGRPFAKSCGFHGGEYTLHGCKAKAFWQTAFKCGRESIPNELLSLAEQVSICKPGTDECVFSKTDVPLDNLRWIGSLSAQAETCNLECVKKNWYAKYQDADLLEYLTYYCRDSGQFYGACETENKLHMPLGKTGSLWPQYYRGSECTWRKGLSVPVEMQFLLPPTPYSAMHDGCGAGEKKYLGTFLDVQDCANRCMYTRGCSNFIFTKWEVFSKCYQTDKCTKDAAFNSYRIDLSCADIKTLEMCVSSVDTRSEYAGSRCAWCCGKKCPSGNRCEAEKYLVSTATKHGEFMTSGSNSCHGASTTRYELLKRNYECKSNNILLVPNATKYKCAMHCSVSPGCKYYIFGHSGAEKNKCYRETTEGPRCLEGWRYANYDFYMLTQSDTPYSRLKKRQWCDVKHFLLSGEVGSAQKCANLCREDHKCRYFAFGYGRCYHEAMEGFCNKWKRNAYTLYMLGDRASKIGGNKYRCTYTKHVITADKICNDRNECGDFSDEASCVDGSWGEWGRCNNTVDGTQSRKCNGPDATYARKGCQGLNKRPCNQKVECAVVKFSNMRITGTPIDIWGQDDPGWSTVDPYIAFYSGTSKEKETPIVENEGNPSWSGDFYVRTKGELLRLVCADSDDGTDDYIGDYGFWPTSFTTTDKSVEEFGYDPSHYKKWLPSSIRNRYSGGSLYYKTTTLEFDYKCYGNKLYSTEASWGGRCECPDGSIYHVSDNGDACKSLSCAGGTMLDCNKKSGEWSYQGVTCLTSIWAWAA